MIEAATRTLRRLLFSGSDRRRRRGKTFRRRQPGDLDFDILHPSGNAGAILRRAPPGYGASPGRGRPGSMPRLS